MKCREFPGYEICKKVVVKQWCETLNENENFNIPLLILAVIHWLPTVVIICITNIFFFFWKSITNIFYQNYNAPKLFSPVCRKSSEIWKRKPRRHHLEISQQSINHILITTNIFIKSHDHVFKKRSKTSHQ